METPGLNQLNSVGVACNLDSPRGRLPGSESFRPAGSLVKVKFSVLAGETK